MLAVYLFVFGVVFNPRRAAAARCAPPVISPRSA
jgi:hypothetical protein